MKLQNAEFVVEFHLPRGKKVILRASNQLCVNDIKERLIRDARHLLSQSRRITEEKINELLKDPADYVLKVVGIDLLGFLAQGLTAQAAECASQCTEPGKAAARRHGACSAVEVYTGGLAYM